MVVACIALVFAMTGAGYAAGMLGPNTVGTKQLKNNAVISSKVKNGSLVKADFKAGQLPAGPAGPAGAPGAPGAAGARGPSDSYEQKLTGAVTSAANTPKSITLSNLPAGSYAIFGSAVLGTTAGSARSSGRCTLSADADTDYSWERLDDGYYGGVNTQLVHTFASTGSVSMICNVVDQPWVLGQNGNDATTKIVAIRTDTATKTSGAGAGPSVPGHVPAGAASATTR
jgi:hypothetical protein